MSLVLGTLTLVDPTRFRPVPYRVERVHEMADGSHKYDVVTTVNKYRVFLEWESLTGAEYAAIKALHSANTSFVFKFPLNGVEQTITVWVADCDPGSMISITPEYYEGVSVELDEV